MSRHFRQKHSIEDKEKMSTNIYFFIKLTVKSVIIDLEPKMQSVTNQSFDGRTDTVNELNSFTF